MKGNNGVVLGRDEQGLRLWSTFEPGIRRHFSFQPVPPEWLLALCLTSWLSRFPTLRRAAVHPHCQHVSVFAVNIL